MHGDPKREGCANPVSRGEAVFVDEAAEPVAPLDGDGWWARGTQPLLGWLGREGGFKT